jgi:hypothetical protein
MLAQNSVIRMRRMPVSLNGFDPRQRPGVALQAATFQMTALSIFGLFAVTAMLVCYALEARSRWFILAFAGACALGSVYGFLQGAWPFGLVEAVWSLVAIRRWALAARQK